MSEKTENAKSAKNKKGTRRRSRQKKSNKSKAQKKPNAQKKQPVQSIELLDAPIVQNFAACGRCSFFWAGYRVITGENGTTSAFTQTPDGMLELVWRSAMRDLVHKSYDVRLDVTHFYDAGVCPECTRSFMYKVSEPEAELDQETTNETSSDAAPDAAAEDATSDDAQTSELETETAVSSDASSEDAPSDDASPEGDEQVEPTNEPAEKPTIKIDNMATDEDDSEEKFGVAEPTAVFVIQLEMPKE